MMILFGVYRSRRILVYFFPNEPVPPVMRIDVLLNMAFSIDSSLIVVRNCHDAITKLS